MKTKFFTLLSLSVLALVMMVSLVSAVAVSEWNLTSDGSAINVNANLNAGTFGSSGVSFVGFHATDGAVADDWSTTSSADTLKYFEVTISPDSDYVLTISDINFDYGASITGPAIFDLEYSKQTDFASPTSIVTETDITSTSFQSSANTVNIVVNSGETLTLRWFGYDFDASSNDFMIKNLVVEGTVELVELEESDFCTWDDGWDNREMDNPGELIIRDIDVTNNGISSTEFGDDETWFPFEEIEVEIEVENKGDYDVDDIRVEWGLYSEETEEWTIEVDDKSEFNLKEDGDSELLTISFLLNDRMDEDLDELDGTYRLYVRATGIIDDSDAGLDDGADTCASDYSEVSIVIENDFVVLDNIQGVEPISCGSQVQITANVWNIGSKDQEKVYVIVQSEELGITEKADVGDIDAFEDKKISVLFNIPEDAEEKSYLFSLMVFDEDGEVFENDDEERAEFQVYLKVEGNCINEPKVDVSADLESEAKAGSELIIKTTVINTGTETSTFELSVSDYLEWATFGSISSESVTLDAGESAEVMITLNVNSDISGNQNFEIIVTEGTKVLVQSVSVMIEEQSGFAGITGGLISEGNWPIWTIGAINIVLVFVIILVALKVARKQ